MASDVESGSLARAIETALADRQLLDHPWYQRWSAGELSADDLRAYAEQYMHFERELPRVLEGIADQLPDGAARDSVLMNHADETADPSHVELFGRYIDVLDGAHEATPSPAMESLVGTYRDLVAAGPAGALGGVMAYESQAAGVAKSKGDGLREHYGMSGSDTEFWDLHATMDLEHGDWALDAVNALDGDQEEIVKSAHAQLLMRGGHSSTSAMR